MLQGLDARTALIYEPVKEELHQVEQALHNLSDVGKPHLSKLLDYVLDAHGKRVRPAMTLLSAKAHPHDHNLPIIMATAVELLHVATLIHDDTVDNSDIRHGKATVSNLWGRNVAVLLGDYVFAASATFVCDTMNIRVIRRFSETIMELSSGELMEYVNAYNWRLTRAEYDDRIFHKTASLFRTACETGAILSGAGEDAVRSLHDYGYNIGMAFQIIDDVLDVQGDPNEIGKPVGNDLLQGVVTLPAIMLIERYPQDNPIQKLFEDSSQEEHLKRALDMIQNSDIIDHCYATVREYYQKAVNAVRTLPASPLKASLEELAAYIMERKR